MGAGGGQSPAGDSAGGPLPGEEGVPGGRRCSRKETLGRGGGATGPSRVPREVKSTAPTLPQLRRLPDTPRTATFLKAQPVAGIGTPVP